jgi:hypothetical protein
MRMVLARIHATPAYHMRADGIRIAVIERPHNIFGSERPIALGRDIVGRSQDLFMDMHSHGKILQLNDT